MTTPAHLVRRAAELCAILSIALTMLAVPPRAHASTISANIAANNDPLFCLAAGFGAGLCDSVVYTPNPNWALGSPQPALVTACTFIVAGNCGGFEATESIAIWNARNVFGAPTANGLTF